MGRAKINEQCAQWLSAMILSCGHHHAKLGDDQRFEGWVRPISVCGINGVDLGCNAHVVERTPEDVRLDTAHLFCIGLQLKGSADILQNKRALRAEPGDVVVFDSSRPMQYHPMNGGTKATNVPVRISRG